MSGRGLTKQGTKNFVKFGLPFMSFVVIGSYGLSEWVGAKIRMKDEKRQQVNRTPRKYGKSRGLTRCVWLLSRRKC